MNILACLDPDRRRLVWSLARTGAISGAQTILEEAVSNKNIEQIENCQKLLRTALHVNSSSNDTMPSCESYNDASMPPLETQFARTGNPCKEETCPLTNPQATRCFWSNICQSEENAKIISRAQEALKSLKVSVAEADARKNRGHKAAM